MDVVPLFTALTVALASCGGGPSATTAQGTTMLAPPAQSLVGTEWLLETLGDAGVLDRVQATLAFPEVGRVAGLSSCNRFTGAVEIGDGKVRFSKLAGTRMVCPPAAMDHEVRYRKALEGAERIAVDGPYLLIFSRGREMPLRFSRRS